METFFKLIIDIYYIKEVGGNASSHTCKNIYLYTYYFLRTLVYCKLCWKIAYVFIYIDYVLIFDFVFYDEYAKYTLIVQN